MKIWVKAAEGKRLPIGGGRLITADGCEVECTPFVQSLIDARDAVVMSDKEAGALLAAREKAAKAAQAEAPAPAAVKEG